MLRSCERLRKALDQRRGLAVVELGVRRELDELDCVWAVGGGACDTDGPCDTDGVCAVGGGEWETGGPCATGGE